VKQLEIGAVAVDRGVGHTGGIIEVHLDSPTGDLLGQVNVNIPVQGARGGGPAGPAGARGGQPTASPAVPPPAPQATGATGGRGAITAGNPFSSVQAPLKLDIKEISGTHDVYFVFKNDKVVPSSALFLLHTVQFNDEIR
jgi:cytochrome c